MTLNEYQRKAMATCMPSCENFSYMMLNLVGEVGEFSSKVAKAIRHEDALIGCDGMQNEFLLMRDAEETMMTELKKEAGDMLWQLSGLCRVMGWDLEDVAQSNLDKLASRAKRGVIDGSGDNR